VCLCVRAVCIPYLFLGALQLCVTAAASFKTVADLLASLIVTEFIFVGPCFDKDVAYSV